VWSDRHGVEWFAWLRFDSEATWVELASADQGQARRGGAENVLNDYGPMRLIRRRGWSDDAIGAGQPPDLACTAGQVLSHVERAVREEGLLCPRSIDLRGGTVQLILDDGELAAVQAWAAFLGLPEPRAIGPALSGHEWWRPYEACADDVWRGWTTVLWCAAPADPAIDGEADSPYTDDPRLRHLLAPSTADIAPSTADVVPPLAEGDGGGTTGPQPPEEPAGADSPAEADTAAAGRGR